MREEVVQTFVIQLPVLGLKEGEGDFPIKLFSYNPPSLAARIFISRGGKLDSGNTIWESQCYELIAFKLRRYFKNGKKDFYADLLQVL